MDKIRVTRSNQEIIISRYIEKSDYYGNRSGRWVKLTLHKNQLKNDRFGFNNVESNYKKIISYLESMKKSGLVEEFSEKKLYQDGYPGRQFKIQFDKKITEDAGDGLLNGFLFQILKPSVKYKDLDAP